MFRELYQPIQYYFNFMVLTWLRILWNLRFKDILQKCQFLDKNARSDMFRAIQFLMHLSV